MKRRVLLIALLIAVLSAAPAEAAERLIVRVTEGLANIQLACLLAGCSVIENIDGSPGDLYLVSSADVLGLNGVIAALLNTTGVVNVEVDTLAHVADSSPAIPPALYDTTPVTYYGATVPHGYVVQPATANIRLADSQAAYPSGTGGGTVAIIDTGVDPNHPALKSSLLPGYDFTRNVSGADETLDISLPLPPVIAGVLPVWLTDEGAGGNLTQSTAAVVNQSTAAVVNGNPGYSDFGHGTMVAGIVHLVAPTAKILPLKAFHSDGTGYNSDILRAIYAAIAAHADVLNMSFTLASYSQEVANALTTASLDGTVAVASAGNSGQETLVYPAALWNVMGVASTNNSAQLSTFSNYGSQLVWIAAPGEGVVTTYPFSTYAACWGTSFQRPANFRRGGRLVGLEPIFRPVLGRRLRRARGADRSKCRSRVARHVPGRSILDPVKLGPLMWIPCLYSTSATLPSGAAPLPGQ